MAINARKKRAELNLEKELDPVKSDVYPSNTLKMDITAITNQLLSVFCFLGYITFFISPKRIKTMIKPNAIYEMTMAFLAFIIFFFFTKMI